MEGNLLVDDFLAEEIDTPIPQVKTMKMEDLLDNDSDSDSSD
jgi:hypothetical protein